MSYKDEYDLGIGNDELFKALSNESYEQLIDRLLKKWLESLYQKTDVSGDLRKR
ncbi:MAG: hypothetical protein AAFY76_03950 [Cyanobacteria bacterium J06649_11]